MVKRETMEAATHALGALVLLRVLTRIVPVRAALRLLHRRSRPCYRNTRLSYSHEVCLSAAHRQTTRILKYWTRTHEWTKSLRAVRPIV